MQRVLTFTLDKKKYVSKEFDFETVCMINDVHNDAKVKGPLNMCRDAVDYMFEGTEATQDIINGLDVNTRARLCIKLWGFYVDVLNEKNE